MPFEYVSIFILPLKYLPEQLTTVDCTCNALILIDHFHAGLYVALLSHGTIEIGLYQ
jgi:hypothetical protein